MQDLVVPGMLHGRVIRPPTIGAKKLISVDESSIRNLPGVTVVRIESLLGVVSSDEWAAVRAARELKATWSEWQGLPGSDELERHVRESAVDHDENMVNKGDAAAAFSTQLRSSFPRLYSWPLPEPRFARSFLCRGGRARRRRDDLDVNARHLWFAGLPWRKFSACPQKNYA